MMRYRAMVLSLTLVAVAALPSLAADEGRHGFANSKGVKIHYVAKGKGPLVVLIHGFPDYWYTWRKQMPELAKHFTVVAIDQRGYNKSDQPKGTENYTVDKLVDDVAAVLDHFKAKQATIVGHDWGGMVAWSFAMKYPKKTSRLIILNLPHPRGLQRELAGNAQQRKNSEYARNFQKPGAAALLKPQLLALWVTEAEARKKYVKAFERSSIEGMLNYYKANYPRPPYKNEKTFPKVRCPVLMFHGLKDPYLLPGALNGTWNWIAGELTLITIPTAGHFVQHDAAQLVTKRMVKWLVD